MQRGALIFLSGRLVTLLILIVFQVLIARALPVAEYASWALVFAMAALMQAVAALGIPRLIPKYISRAGVTLSWHSARALAGRLLLLRMLGTSGLMGVTYLAAVVTGHGAGADGLFVAIAAAFILTSLLQADADAMAQALSLQRISRVCTIGEAASRLALVGLAIRAGDGLTAMQILLISAGSAAAFAFLLLGAVFGVLWSQAPVENAQPLDSREIRRTGLAGYAGSMAWFCSSPGVVRVIASQLLGVASFAGFAFAQTLVLSFQRYTPGALLFPFVEPNAMRHYSQTGDRERLWRILSLTVKIDMVVIGAAIIGASIAGPFIVDAISDGKYGGYAFVVPVLLVYIIMSSVYRSFETVALALGASSILLRTFVLSTFWLGLAVLLAGRFGLVVLLAFPICDALSRLVLVYTSMVRRGLKPAVDASMNGMIVALVALCSVAGVEARRVLGLEGLSSLFLGLAAVLVFGLALLVLRPFRAGEGRLVLGSRTEAVMWMLREGPKKGKHEQL